MQEDVPTSVSDLEQAFLGWKHRLDSLIGPDTCLVQAQHDGTAYMAV